MAQDSDDLFVVNVLIWVLVVVLAIVAIHTPNAQPYHVNVCLGSDDSVLRTYHQNGTTSPHHASPEEQDVG